MTIVRGWLVASVALFIAAIPGSSGAALRTVVAEEFSSTTCRWCPSAMQGLHNLQQQVGNRVAVVTYHGDDVFEVPGCADRKSYYGIVPLPTVVFDGIIQVVGGDTIPMDYTQSYNQREAVPSPLTIELNLLSYDGSTGEGSVMAGLYGEPGNPPVSGSLRCVVAGDDTLFNWQGFDHLYFTALHVFPSAAGIPVTVPPGESVILQLPFLIPAGWRDRECTIVAFLQDDTTKEIVQAGHMGQVTPVELVNFTAQTVRDGVLLSWATASETHNAGFRIRRSADGHEEIITDGMIPGAGDAVVPRTYGFLDSDVRAGTSYLYTLSDISLTGIERFHSPISVCVPPTWGAPLALHMEPARPCPATRNVTLRYSLPNDGPFSLKVFDVAGRKVRDLADGSEGAGFHTSVWDLADDAGSRVAPGLYIARLAAGDTDTVRGVVVTR